VILEEPPDGPGLGGGSPAELQRLVDAADDAALLRAVDALAASRRYDALADLARRCRDAVEVGRQLWGVAEHIDYRLALEGPPSHAGAVLHPGAGRFTLGPLTEVAAGAHRWADLEPHVGDLASRTALAQERVIRGEDLHGAADVDVDLPLRLAAWEPAYALPRYRDREALFPAPTLPAPRAGSQRLAPGARLPRDEAAEALAEVAAAWASQSEGRLAVAAVEGDAQAAVGALAGEAATVALEPSEALGLLQWAGASGGARGRRRGGAAGRFAAWWAAAALCGLPWPEDGAGEALADELGDALGDLEWLRWQRPEVESGWVLRLAVADPIDGLAWAVEAVDAVDDDAAGRPVADEAG